MVGSVDEEFVPVVVMIGSPELERWAGRLTLSEEFVKTPFLALGFGDCWISSCWTGGFAEMIWSPLV